MELVLAGGFVMAGTILVVLTLILKQLRFMKTNNLSGKYTLELRKTRS